MKSQQIGTRLGVAFGVLIAILSGIGYLGLSRADQSNANLNDILGKRWIKMQLAREALTYSNRNSRITMQIFLLKDQKAIGLLLAQRAENSKKIVELLSEIGTRCESEDEKNLFDLVREARTPYINSYLRALHLLVDEQKRDAAAAVIVQETLPALFKYHAAWNDFVQFQMDQVDQAARRSRAHYSATRRVVLLLVVLASLAGVAIGIFATRSMVREITARVRAECEVQKLNAELEDRVIQRTRELADANQHLISEIEERRRAEEQLRVQSTALGAAANSIVITDCKGTIKWVNPAFSRMTGYSAEEALGQNPRLVSSGLHPSSFYANLWHTIASGSVWYGEITNRRKNGSLYTEEMTITPVRNESGDISHFIAIKQDVTERNKAEQQLRESEERFRLAFEKGPLGIMLVSPDYRFLKVNEALCAMTGYSEQELLGVSVSDITHPEDIERDVQLSTEILKGEVAAHNWEKRYIRKDGAILWADLASTVIRDLSGKPLYAQGIIADISERKRAEEALRQAEENYRGIFEEAIVGIFQSTPNGHYLSANPALARMFGYDSPQELIASVTDISRQVYVDPNQREEIKRVLEQQEAVRNCECEVYRKDGSKMWISAHIRAVRKNGVLERYEGMNEDITERKLLGDQLRQSQKMEAVGRLAGGVAHDFNNALGIITGYSEILQEGGVSTETSQRFLEEIKKAALGAASLTRQLLAFSRKQVIQPTILNFNSIITGLEKMLRRLIGEDINITAVLDPDLGCLKADRGQIEQVLMNLAINARDAMPKGGKIIIKTANAELDDVFARQHAYVKPGHYVMLSMSDTGCGMDKETLSHIFEPFFTTKEVGKGTGLGLSMVYGVVKQSNGYIWASSEPGQGSTFKIFLPRFEKHVEPPRAAELDDAITGGSETILLVEDEEPLRQLTRSFLEEKGYSVLTANNGETAIEIAKEYAAPIHLLLTDVIMPGISGSELAERLVLSRPEMNVIYMSGYTDDRVALHGILTSGTVILEKPFTRNWLLRKIRDQLDIRNTVRET
ncbi:MAG TPA: PAS domain S-box protein [Terriglobales bacterium]|nr:PAS domain S-box protein [Terriglobales bacterium]